MTRDIVVQLNRTAVTDSSVNVAVHLARHHSAHLTGLCTVDVARAVGLATGMIGCGPSVSLLRLTQQLRDEALEQARATEVRFCDRLRREEVEGEWRLAAIACKMRWMASNPP